MIYTIKPNELREQQTEVNHYYRMRIINPTKMQKAFNCSKTTVSAWRFKQHCYSKKKKITRVVYVPFKSFLNMGFLTSFRLFAITFTSRGVLIPQTGVLESSLNLPPLVCGRTWEDIFSLRLWFNNKVQYWEFTDLLEPLVLS